MHLVYLVTHDTCNNYWFLCIDDDSKGILWHHCLLLSFRPCEETDVRLRFHVPVICALSQSQRIERASRMEESSFSTAFSPKKRWYFVTPKFWKVHSYGKIKANFHCGFLLKDIYLSGYGESIL